MIVEVLDATLGPWFGLACRLRLRRVLTKTLGQITDLLMIIQPPTFNKIIESDRTTMPYAQSDRKDAALDNAATKILVHRSSVRL